MVLANPWLYILFWVISIKNQIQDQVQGSAQERTVSGTLIDPRSSLDWSRVPVDQLSIELTDEGSENHVFFFFSRMCYVWSPLMGWVIVTLIREPWVQKKIEKIFYDVVVAIGLIKAKTISHPKAAAEIKSSRGSEVMDAMGLKLKYDGFE